MNFWVIVLTACLLSGLVVAAALLWVGINAMTFGRVMPRNPAVALANLGRTLHSCFNDTLRESLPDDLRDLLRKLARPGRRQTKRRNVGRLAFN